MPILIGWTMAKGCLRGRVYHDKRFPDGTTIVTARVAKRYGQWARTEKGTVYALLSEDMKELLPLPVAS